MSAPEVPLWVHCGRIAVSAGADRHGHILGSDGIILVSQLDREYQADRLAR